MEIMYTTLPDQKSAEKIAHKLLESQSIACANIIPMHSMYRWEGAITKDKEYILLCKCTSKQSTKAKKMIKQLHPYQIPFIASSKREVNADYLDRAKGT